MLRMVLPNPTQGGARRVETYLPVFGLNIQDREAPLPSVFPVSIHANVLLIWRSYQCVSEIIVATAADLSQDMLRPRLLDTQSKGTSRTV